MGRMDNKPIGFDLKGTPLGKLDDDSYYSMGYNDFTLADLFDGYIFLKPISGLSSCSIDYKFMDDTNWNEAVSNNPDPRRGLLVCGSEAIALEAEKLLENR